MGSLTNRVKELEDIEARYQMFLLKAREDLGSFLTYWEDKENKLPTDPYHQVALIRNLYKFIEEK